MSDVVTTLKAARNKWTTLLVALGFELYSAHLIGNAPPSTRERLERMSNPQIKDLVMETSSGAWCFGLNGNYRTHPDTAIGLLVKIADEPYPYDEPWDEIAEGKSHPLEKVFYIQPLNGDSVVRWTNANFVTIIPIEGWKTSIGNNRPCLHDALYDLYEYPSVFDEAIKLAEKGA